MHSDLFCLVCCCFFFCCSNRSIYQKFREVDLLDKKKTVTALKPGEDRAILLGLGMILASVMMYFVLGITILRSYADRYVCIPFLRHYSAVTFSNMFYSSAVLVDKLLQGPLRLKIAINKCFMRPRFQAQIAAQTELISVYEPGQKLCCCCCCFCINTDFYYITTQCLDRGECLCRAQRHGHSRHELYIQLWLRLLENLQIPLSAGLCERQQHGPPLSAISQRGDAGRQLWSELRAAGKIQGFTEPFKCWPKPSHVCLVNVGPVGPGLSGQKLFVDRVSITSIFRPFSLMI